jgi:hypothetical protein
MTTENTSPEVKQEETKKEIINRKVFVSPAKLLETYSSIPENANEVRDAIRYMESCVEKEIAALKSIETRQENIVKANNLINEHYAKMGELIKKAKEETGK